MNEQLSAVLLQLTDPKELLKFAKDPAAFLETIDLPKVDKFVLASRHRGLIKYQARFGDLTEERLRSLDFISPDSDQDVDVDLHPNHEHDVDHEDAEQSSKQIKRSFGPHTRFVDPK